MSVTTAGEGECRRDGFDMCADDFASRWRSCTRSTRLPVGGCRVVQSVPDLGVSVEQNTDRVLDS
jgi:hypothetical protein